MILFTWSYTSDEITINPISVDGIDATTLGIDLVGSFNLTYNGESQAPTISDIDFSGSAFSASDFTIGTTIGDSVNASVYKGEKPYVLLTINKAGYSGSIHLTYSINPVTITQDNVDEFFSAEYATTSMPYTGNAITLTRDDFKITDKLTGEDITSICLAENAQLSLTKTEAKAGAVIDDVFQLQTVASNLGYNFAIPNSVNIEPTNNFTVTQRDLSTVNVSIPEQSYTNGTITIDPRRMTFTEKDTNISLDLTGDIASVTVSGSTVGSQEVTISPKANNKNVTGTTTATVRVADTSLSRAVFENQSYAEADEEYTGERITKDISRLGSVKIGNQVISPDNYDIEFGTNINAGTGTIRIVGKNSYTGSIKEISFTINPAVVNADTVEFNEYVEKIDTRNAADYKDAIGLVVKAENADGQEFTLTENDYVAEYAFAGDGSVGTAINVTLVTDANSLLKNTNFKVEGTLAITPEITKTILRSENIQFRQTSYTYTGEAIEPVFDVVVDGAVISPDQYTVKSLTNNINAGTATVTITGTNNADSVFSADVDASATFTITPADADDFTATIPAQEYTGYSLRPSVEGYVELNGVNINVADNFTVTYGENINIGEGTVTLTPKNDNFTGTKTLTFTIAGQMLSGGDLNFYDENGRVVTPAHNYDGTAYEVARTIFNSSTTNGLDGATLTEGTDYEIRYVDNVYGKKVGNEQKGAVLVIAQGRYAGDFTGNYSGSQTALVEDGIYTDVDGNKIANVIYAEDFTITQQDVARSNVSVSNGTYAGGLAVRPVVEINVMGKTLVEGTDYELNLDGNTDMVNATENNTLTVTVEFKNGYKAANGANMKFNWGIDKFDFADAEVTVDGNDVTVKCGRVDVPTSEYTVTRDAEADTVTITAVEDSKNYTGTKTVSAVVEDPAEAPEAPMIQAVNVNGNNATVILSGESDGATGYDYVISTDRDCINNKDYDKVNKNILSTQTTFTYTQQGVYYAYCHAWKRVDGVKVFSEWSNAYPFVVSAITPEQPVITSVKKSGRNLTVTWTQSENATTGYDIVMGTAMRKVNGEMRPVEYGKAVKKVGPNTFSVTFRSIPKGTYYVGLHAHNRTSETGVKVFSPWSNAKKVTF